VFGGNDAGGEPACGAATEYNYFPDWFIHTLKPENSRDCKRSGAAQALTISGFETSI
jgi:hypothetical protein